MYSQYIDGKFSPVSAHTQAHPNQPTHNHTNKPTSHPDKALLGDVTSGISNLFRGILKQFSAESLDTGDILLVLIILFLFLEGDNLELVITLGLMLLLGLHED